ncbi:MAG: diguanylate cyclase [Conexibacter sp.]|nr:diguanylate cyclase [Conexibacter sp.]
MARPRLSLFVVLLPIALVAIGLAMVMTARSQRNVATRAADRTDAANRLLLGMVDQETGLRGYLLTRREVFLDPFHSGARGADLAEREIRAEGHDDGVTLALIDRYSQFQGSWQRLAQAQVNEVRDDPRFTPSIAGALQRKRLMDRIRVVDAQLKQRLTVRRDRDLTAAGRRAEALVVLLTALLGAGAYVLLTRDARRRRAAYRHELAYRQSQREFTDVIQVVRSEPEAHALLKRHLELVMPGVRTTVLRRNHSDNRLEATTEVPADSPLAARLPGAQPRSCVAIRLGRRHEELAGDDRLLSCTICGGTPGGSTCAPLLVAGSVIGSVLVERAGGDADDDEAERHLDDTVAQAAPVIANLRNLALAERQAATDALTGLPNRRAVQDALVRMTARATRSGAPLAAIALDLDHFKDINDRFGHDMGDAVLAHVGALLSSSCRLGDVIGRVGGEEFIVLAPDTGLEGALVLAENLRAALQAETVPGLDRDVTGSFGIAVLPDHAATSEALLRLADRALYSAKGAGRNRVEVIAGAGVTPL